MSNTDPGAPEYQYEWQNPDSKKFDFGRTFTRSVDILKRRGLKMVFISCLLIALPFFLIGIWPMFMSGGLQDIILNDDPDAILEVFSGGIFVVLIVGIILTLIASLWLQPALIKISYGALIDEDMPTFSILKNVTRFVLPVFGFYILYFLAVMFGLLLLIIPALFIGLGWMLSSHIIVLEEQGVMDSISRSWTLSKGSKRWLFLLAIVFGLIGAIVSVVISIPVYLMGDPNVAMLEGASAAYWIFNGLVSAIAQVFATVIGVAWSTAAYVELRKIREGVDPESQVDVFS